MVQNTRIQNLVFELKRRRVFRVATLYVVSMWPIIQIADILSPALNLPNGAMQILLLVFISGFPIAIALTWIFNLTPKGLVKVEAIGEAENPEAESRLIGKNVELIIVSVLLLIAIGLFVFQSGITNSQHPSGSLSSAVQNKKIESLAVLPFVPFSDNKEDEYFADGLSEELLNVLAKIKTLRVVARTSSFAYKGVNKNIQKVGRELGVDAILEGSVRRNDVDNTIRVTAQLIDVRSGTHLWSDTYDRKFNDIFKIQDEITAAVVDELKITLLVDEKKHLMAHETANPDAMIAHSKGRTELAKRTGASIIKAEQHFRDAIRDDPGYATAYASLAESYILSVSYAGNPYEESSDKAQKAVDKALQIDPNLGLAWAAQGLIYYSNMDNKDKAIEALEKAIELNPSYAMAYMWYGSLQEDNSKRAEYYQKAFQLDPKSPVAGYNVANNLVEMGKDNEAMEIFSKIVDADPYYPGAYMLVAQINQFSGKIVQAITQYKKAHELGANKNIALEISSLYADLGDQMNTRYWFDIAKEGSTDDYKGKLAWVEFTTLLVEGRREEAISILNTFKTVEKPELNLYYRSVVANYFLRDYPETIKQFERAEELRKSKDLDPLSHGAIDIYLYASYAYQQLEEFDKSDIIIQQIMEEQERLLNAGERISSSYWYQKSLLQAISGDQQMALITLQRAIDEGWSEIIRVNEEPILQQMQSDSNFQAMIAGLEAKMNLMREQLAFEESINDHWRG